MKFPTKKHIIVCMTALEVTEGSREKGRKGATVNDGSGPENCSKERI